MIITNTTATGYLNISTIESINKIIDNEYIYQTNLIRNYSYKDIEQVKAYLSEYVNALDSFKRKYKEKKNVEAYRVEYMLPKEIYIKGNRANINKLIKEIVEEFAQGQKVNYFVTLEQDYKYKSLVIYILDRNYYPEGKTIVLKRTKDMYTSIETGKIISKDVYLENPDKCKIVYERGDEYEKTILMSDKMRFEGILNFANKQTFIANLMALKRNIALFYAKIFNHKLIYMEEYIKKRSFKQLMKKDGVYFHSNKRIDKYNKYYYFKRRKLKAYNNLVDHLNFQLMNFKLISPGMFQGKLDIAKELLDELEKYKLINEYEGFVNRQIS